jgi:hypothetical protein
MANPLYEAAYGSNPFASPTALAAAAARTARHGTTSEQEDPAAQQAAGRPKNPFARAPQGTPTSQIPETAFEAQSGEESLPQGQPELSMPAKAGMMALNAVGAVGNILDTPGSMVRDLITLAPGGSAPRNPFDQILDPMGREYEGNRIEGREMLRDWGLADKKHDTWTNFLGGLALEIATDPLTYVGSMGLTKIGQVFANMGIKKMRPLAREMAEIAGKNSTWMGGQFAKAAVTGNKVFEHVNDFTTKRVASRVKQLIEADQVKDTSRKSTAFHETKDLPDTIEKADKWAMVDTGASIEVYKKKADSPTWEIDLEANRVARNTLDGSVLKMTPRGFEDRMRGVYSNLYGKDVPASKIDEMLAKDMAKPVRSLVSVGLPLSRPAYEKTLAKPDDRFTQWLKDQPDLPVRQPPKQPPSTGQAAQGTPTPKPTGSTTKTTAPLPQADLSAIKQSNAARGATIATKSVVSDADAANALRTAGFSDIDIKSLSGTSGKPLLEKLGAMHLLDDTGAIRTSRIGENATRVLYQSAKAFVNPEGIVRDFGILESVAETWSKVTQQPADDYFKMLQVTDTASDLGADVVAKMKYNLRTGERLILATEKATQASDFFHEVGHDIEKMFKGTELEPLMEEAIDSKLRAVSPDARMYDDVTNPDGSYRLTTEASESLAEGLEEFLLGQGPKEYQGLFSAIKDIVASTVKAITGAGRKPSDAMQDFYARLTKSSATPEAEVAGPKRPRGRPARQTASANTEPATFSNLEGFRNAIANRYEGNKFIKENNIKIEDVQNHFTDILRALAKADGFDDVDKYINSNFFTPDAVRFDGIVRDKTAGNFLQRNKSGKATDQPRGAIRFGSSVDDSRAVADVFFGPKADLTTIAHELGHLARRRLSTELLSATEKSYGVVGGKWTEALEEEFARDFELYLKSGKAPTTALEAAFAAMKDWLSKLYAALRNSDKGREFPEERRELFDRIFGGTPEAPKAAKESVGTGNPLQSRAVTTTPTQVDNKALNILQPKVGAQSTVGQRTSLASTAKSSSDIPISDGVVIASKPTSTGRVSPIQFADMREVVSLRDKAGREALFYRSFMGTGGKSQGSWYPIGGVANMKDGYLWIIKGDMVNDPSYGRPDLEKLTKIANKVLPKTDEEMTEFIRLHLGTKPGDRPALDPSLQLKAEDFPELEHGNQEHMGKILNRWKNEYLNKTWGQRGESAKPQTPVADTTRTRPGVTERTSIATDTPKANILNEAAETNPVVVREPAQDFSKMTIDEYYAIEDPEVRWAAYQDLRKIDGVWFNGMQVDPLRHKDEIAKALDGNHIARTQMVERAKELQSQGVPLEKAVRELIGDDSGPRRSYNELVDDLNDRVIDNKTSELARAIGWRPDAIVAKPKNQIDLSSVPKSRSPLKETTETVAPPEASQRVFDVAVAFSPKNVEVAFIDGIRAQLQGLVDNVTPETAGESMSTFKSQVTQAVRSMRPDLNDNDLAIAVRHVINNDDRLLSQSNKLRGVDLTLRNNMSTNLLEKLKINIGGNKKYNPQAAMVIRDRFDAIKAAASNIDEPLENWRLDPEKLRVALDDESIGEETRDLIVKFFDKTAKSVVGFKQSLARQAGYEAKKAITYRGGSVVESMTEQAADDILRTSKPLSTVDEAITAGDEEYARIKQQIAEVRDDKTLSKGARSSKLVTLRDALSKVADDNRANNKVLSLRHDLETNRRQIKSLKALRTEAKNDGDQKTLRMLGKQLDKLDSVVERDERALAMAIREREAKAAQTATLTPDDAKEQLKNLFLAMNKFKQLASAGGSDEQVARWISQSEQARNAIAEQMEDVARKADATLGQTTFTSTAKEDAYTALMRKIESHNFLQDDGTFKPLTSYDLKRAVSGSRTVARKTTAVGKVVYEAVQKDLLSAEDLAVFEDFMARGKTDKGLLSQTHYDNLRDKLGNIKQVIGRYKDTLDKSAVASGDAPIEVVEAYTRSNPVLSQMQDTLDMLVSPEVTNALSPEAKTILNAIVKYDVKDNIATGSLLPDVIPSKESLAGKGSLNHEEMWVAVLEKAKSTIEDPELQAKFDVLWEEIQDSLKATDAWVSYNKKRTPGQVAKAIISHKIAMPKWREIFDFANSTGKDRDLAVRVLQALDIGENLFMANPATRTFLSLFSQSVYGTTNYDTQELARLRFQAYERSIYEFREMLYPITRYLGSTGMFDVKTIATKKIEGGMARDAANTFARNEINKRNNEIIRFLEAKPERAHKLSDEVFKEYAASLDDFETLLQSLKDAFPNLLNDQIAAGLDASQLFDTEIDYFTRNYTEPGKYLRSRTSGEALMSGKMKSHEPRKDAYRHIPGGRALLNEMSLDPKLSGIAHSEKMLGEGLSKDSMKAAREHIRTTYGYDQIVSTHPDHGFWDNGELTKAGKKKVDTLIRSLAHLPLDHIEHQVPMFGHNFMRDFASYAESHYTKVALGLTVQDLVIKSAVYSQDQAMRVSKLFKGTALDTHQAYVNVIRNTDNMPAYRNWLDETIEKRASGDNPLISIDDTTGVITDLKNNREYKTAADYAEHKMLARNFADNKLGLSVPKEIHEAATEFLRAWSTPKQLTFMTQVAGAALNTFKGMVTLPFAAFHVRNFISGNMQNIFFDAYDPSAIYGGVYNPVMGYVKPVMQAATIANGNSVAGISNEIPQFLWRNDIAGDLKPGAPETDGAVTEWVRNRVFKFGLTGDKQGQAAEKIGDTASSLISQLPGSTPRNAANWYGLKPALFDKTTSLPQKVNPIGFRGSMYPTKSQPPGHGRPSLALATTDETTNLLGRAGEEASLFVENANRIAPFLAFLKQGILPEEAARRVNMIQFNYSDLSEFERRYMKQLFPFYTFTSKALKLTLGDLVTNPAGKQAWSIRATGKLQDPEQPMPEHIRRGIAIPLPEGPGGEDRYLSGFGLAWEDPVEMMSFMTGDARTSFAGAFTKLRPELQLFGEMAFGRSAFFGRDHQDLDPQLGRLRDNLLGQPKKGLAEPFLGSPGLEVLVGKLPTARAVNTANQAFDDRKSSVDKLLNMASGFKVTTVNEEAKQRLMMNTLNEELKDLGAREMALAYLPEWKKERLSEGELRRVQQLQSMINALKKESRENKKQAELENLRAAASAGGD